jgi:hypothetical protein
VVAILEMIFTIKRHGFYMARELDMVLSWHGRHKGGR